MRAAGGVLRRVDSGVALAAVVTAAFFWIAFDDASYELAGRTTLAIALWWALALGLLLRLLSPRRLPGTTVVVALLLLALALWTLGSLVWAPSAEDAFNEFNRVTLYLWRLPSGRPRRRPGQRRTVG